MKKTNYSFDKPRVVYSIKSYPGLFIAVFFSEKDNNYHSFTIKEKKAVSLTIQGEPIKALSLKDVRSLIRNSFIIGFGNSKLDDFVLKEAIETVDAQKAFECFNAIKESKKPAYSLGYKGLYGSFDAQLATAVNSQLELLKAHLNYPINTVSLQDGFAGPWTRELADSLLIQLKENVELISQLLKTTEVDSYLRQQVGMIRQYFPNKNYLLNTHGSELVTKALTDNDRLVIKQQTAFNYEWFGNQLLEGIPEEWKQELIRYSTELEKAFLLFKEKTTGVTSPFEKKKLASSILGGVTKPVVELPISDDFVFVTSAGGGHSIKQKKDNKPIIEAKNVGRWDVVGAYGTLIRLSGILDGELQSRNEDFFKYKLLFKEAAALLDDPFDETEDGSVFDYDSIQQRIKDSGIQFEKGLNYTELKQLVDGGVITSKLTTNLVSGLLDDASSTLYNPIAMINLRLILQLILYPLLKELNDNGFELLSVNTDGFDCVVHDWDGYYKAQAIITEWEKRYQVPLEGSFVTDYKATGDNARLVVNNGTVIEAKGNDLIHQAFSPTKLGSLPRIVDTVLLQKLIKPELDVRAYLEKLKNDGRFELFQWVLKPSAGKQLVFDYTIKKPINRVFLTKEGYQVNEYSAKTDETNNYKGMPSGALVSIMNDRVDQQSFAELELSLDDYYQLLEPALKRWGVE